MFNDKAALNRPVLIIDDSPMYRTAAKGMLQKLGYSSPTIDFAQDAKEAISKCRTNNYALVFFDYNLGKKANGYQLIDELKQKQLLPPDCVNIIVTADSTPEVVRGFMELEPDGYLLKPLNYTTLKERLPQFSNKKRHLGDVMTIIGNQDYQKAIDVIDQAFYKQDDIIVRSQILKAQALIGLGKLDEARNILINVKDSPEQSSVNLQLAKLAFDQRQYKQAIFLATQVKQDAFRSAQAHELCAEIYAAQSQYEQAVDEVEAALAISPKVIERHLKRIAYNLALFDLKSAISSIVTMQAEVKNSFRDNVDHYVLGASITLDQAQFQSNENRDVHIASVAKLVDQWRQQFVRDEYKAFELLLFSRVYHLKSDFQKSRAYFKQYLDLLSEQPEREITLYEKIELTKASFAVHDTDQYRAAAKQVTEHLRNAGHSPLNQPTFSYFQQYRSKAEQGYAHIVKVKEHAKQYIASKHFEKASMLLSKAVSSNVVDSEICLLTMEVLTHSWPLNWNRNQVLRNALLCKEHLHGTKYEKTKRFYKACDTLAKQLKYSDLKVTGSLSV